MSDVELDTLLATYIKVKPATVLNKLNPTVKYHQGNSPGKKIAKNIAGIRIAEAEKYAARIDKKN